MLKTTRSPEINAGRPTAIPLPRRLARSTGRVLGPRRRALAAGRALLVGVLAVTMLEADAHAYTDPGSGALLWQALVAGMFGAMFYARRFWNWLGSRRNPREDTSPPREKE